MIVYDCCLSGGRRTSRRDVVQYVLCCAEAVASASAAALVFRSVTGHPQTDTQSTSHVTSGSLREIVREKNVDERIDVSDKRSRSGRRVSCTCFILTSTRCCCRSSVSVCDFVCLSVTVFACRQRHSCRHNNRPTTLQ